MCPLCGGKHAPVMSSIASHEPPTPWGECLKAANRRMDALEKALVEMARSAAIAGQPVSSVVGG